MEFACFCPPWWTWGSECFRLFRSFILILHDLIGKYMGQFCESIFVNHSLVTSCDAHAKINLSMSFQESRDWWNITVEVTEKLCKDMKGEAIWKNKKMNEFQFTDLQLPYAPATKVLAKQRPSLWCLAMWDLDSCYSPLVQCTRAPASSYTAWRKWTQHLQSWTIFALAHLSWQEAFVKWDSLCSSSACFD